MTLALAHGQYSHYFRPLSSFRCRRGVERGGSSSGYVPNFVAVAPPSPSPAVHFTCSSRVAGPAGTGAYCSVLLETFFTIYVPFPRGVTLFLSLGCPPALSCMAFNNAHIFMARSDELGTGFGRGRIDGQEHHHILCDFSSPCFFFFFVFDCCCVCSLLVCFLLLSFATFVA